MNVTTSFQVSFINSKFYFYYISQFDLEITDFHKFAGDFIKITSEFANEVEKEKMKAIGIRNLLHSVSKEHDAKKQQLEV